MKTSRNDAWKPPSTRRVRDVATRLSAVYGVPRMAPHGDPLAELVLTVLSQSTNDRNRDVAYLRLRERLGSWEAVRDAPLGEVEEAIRPGGISKVKSARIQAILQAITATARDPANPLRPGDPANPLRPGDPAGPLRPGDPASPDPANPLRPGDPAGPLRPGDPADPLRLDWMAQAPVAQSRDYLTALPGVGRKTAACVLLFTWGLRDVPVDTHVSRVGGRLRLLRAQAGLDEQHDQMLALAPRGRELELHVNLLRHGRRTCFARRPACTRCALARMCPSRGIEG